MYGISIPTDMLHFSARKFFREPSSFLTDRLEHRLTAILLVYDEMYLNCYVQFCNSPTVISAPNACRLELILKINLRNIKSFNILWTVCCKRSGQFNQISFLITLLKQYQEKWLQDVQRMDTNRIPKQARKI